MCVYVYASAAAAGPRVGLAETRCTNTRNENVLVETKLKLNAALWL